MEVLNHIKNLDLNILQFINLHRNISLDNFFILFTDSAAPITFGLPFVLLVMALISGSKSLEEKVYFMSMAILCSIILSGVFKYLINRPRPFTTHHFIQKVGDGGSPSFPSGHTCDAFVISACIGIVYPRWYTVLPSYVWAFIVAYSRIDLGVHYPSDVLGGMLIGTGSALIVYLFRQKLLKLFYLIRYKHEN